MCGIVGLILTDNKPSTGLWSANDQYSCLQNLGKIPTVMRDLLVFDTVRGWDGTGYAQCENIFKNDDVIKCHKSNLDGPQFVQHLRVLDMLNHMDRYRFHLGHNRMSTKGSSSSQNAHPFKVNNIIGVHNGGISNIIGMKDFHSFDVDSNAAIAYIQREDIKAFCKNAVGAYTIVYFDTVDTSFHIIRTNDRPLKMYQTKSFIAFGSEGEMVKAALARNNKDIEKEIEIKAGVHYQFDYFTDGGIKWEEEEMEMYKEPPKVVSSNNYRGGYQTKKESATDGYPTGDKILKALDLAYGESICFIAEGRMTFNGDLPKSGEKACIVGEDLIENIEVTIRSLSLDESESQQFLGEYCKGELFTCFYAQKEKKIVLLVKDLAIMTEAEVAEYEAACYDSVNMDIGPKITGAELVDRLSTISAPFQESPTHLHSATCSICNIVVNSSSVKTIIGHPGKYICVHCQAELSFNQKTHIN